MGGHALTCAVNCQECCSELADQEIHRAKEQDLRQPRVSSSSRFKTFFFFFSQLPSCSNCQCSEVSLERQRHPGRRREPLNVSWNTFRVGEATGEHRQMEESLHKTTVLYGLFFWEGLCLYKTNFMKRKYLRRLQRRGSQSGRAGVAAVTQGRHLGEGGWVLQPRR